MFKLRNMFQYFFSIFVLSKHPTSPLKPLSVVSLPQETMGAVTMTVPWLIWHGNRYSLCVRRFEEDTSTLALRICKSYFVRKWHIDTTRILGEHDLPGGGLFSVFWQFHIFFTFCKLLFVWNCSEMLRKFEPCESCDLTKTVSYM